MGKLDIDPDLLDNEVDDAEDGDAVESTRLPVSKHARRRLEEKIEELRLKKNISDYDFDDV